MQNKIPKIIHYIWLGGKPIPEKDQSFIEGWKKLHPDYEFKLWNESNVDLNACEYIKEAVKHKKWSFISDYIRAYVLYNYGGIYIDTDVELMKPFDEFLKYDFFTSFENMVILNPAITGATKGNKLVGELLDHFNRKKFFMDKRQKKVDTFIMPIVASVIFKKKFGLKLNNTFQELKVDDMTCAFLTRDYYHAQDYVSGEIEVTENTHGIHRYAGSWLSAKNKKEDRTVIRIRKFLGDKLFRKFMKLFLKLRVIKYTKIYNKQEKQHQKQLKKQAKRV